MTKLLNQNLKLAALIIFIIFGSLIAAKKYDNPSIKDKLAAHFEVGATSYEITPQELSRADWFHLRGQYKVETNYFATPSGLVECLSITK